MECRIEKLSHKILLNYLPELQSKKKKLPCKRRSESRSCDCCRLQTEMWYMDSCHSRSRFPCYIYFAIIVCNQITFPFLWERMVPRLTIWIFFSRQFPSQPPGMASISLTFPQIFGVCFAFPFRGPFLHYTLLCKKCKRAEEEGKEALWML